MANGRGNLGGYSKSTQSDPKPLKIVPVNAVQLKSNDTVGDIVGSLALTQRAAPTVSSYMTSCAKNFVNGVWTVKPWALPAEWSIHIDIILVKGEGWGNLWSFGYHANGVPALTCQIQWTDSHYSIALKGSGGKEFVVPMEVNSDKLSVTVVGNTSINALYIYINGRFAGVTTGIPYSTGIFSASWGLCIGSNMAYDYGYLTDPAYGMPNKHTVLRWLLWNQQLTATQVGQLNDVGTKDKVWLYNNGDRMTAITGDWGNIALSNSNVVSNAGNIAINVTTDAGYGGIRTLGNVNVPDAKYICMQYQLNKVSGTPKIYLGYGGTDDVYNNFAANVNYPRPTTGGGNANGMAVLRCPLEWRDLNHKVKVALSGGTASLYVYGIWLE